MEQGDHFVVAVAVDQSMHVARGFEDVASRLSDPIVLQIAPRSLDHITVHRSRMPMPAQNSGLANAKKIDPKSGDTIEYQGAEPDILCLWNPQSLVIRHGLRDQIAYAVGK